LQEFIFVFFIFVQMTVLHSWRSRQLV